MEIEVYSRKYTRERCAREHEMEVGYDVERVVDK